MKGALWKLLTPIASAILGIWAANKFNLFEFLTFIPTDYVYEVCITVYFAIIDVILEILRELLCNFLKEKFFSEIEVIIYQTNTEPNIKNNPTLIFNSEDQTEACILVSVKGNKKHFKNARIQIENPACAEIQGNYKSRAVSIDNDTYCISLEDLFGGYNKSNFEQKFRIVLAQIPVDDECIAEIRPEIIKKRFNVLYKHNCAKVKARRR